MTSSSAKTEPASKYLQSWMAEWYEASVLGRGNPSETVERFKKTVQFNSKLLDEAKRHLENIEDIPNERCFITNTHRHFLRKVTS